MVVLYQPRDRRRILQHVIMEEHITPTQPQHYPHNFHNLRFHYNPFFVGRAHEQQFALDEMNAGEIARVSGPANIGKTALAAHLTHTQKYPAILWIDCNQSRQTQYDEVARKWRISKEDPLTAIGRTLLQSSKSLVVFDNVTGETELPPSLVEARDAQHHVLLAGREFSTYGSIVLPPLSAEEGTEFIFMFLYEGKYSPEPLTLTAEQEAKERVAAQRITEFFQGDPFLVKRALFYMEEVEYSAHDFAEILFDPKQDWLLETLETHAYYMNPGPLR